MLKYSQLYSTSYTTGSFLYLFLKFSTVFKEDIFFYYIQHTTHLKDIKISINIFLDFSCEASHGFVFLYTIESNFPFPNVRNK